MKIFNKYSLKQRLNQFLSEVANKKNKEELKSFFEAILTPEELKEIPTRLEIVKMLKTGISQKKISKALGVGIATITRGSKELSKGNFKNVISWHLPN